MPIFARCPIDSTPTDSVSWVREFRARFPKLFEVYYPREDHKGGTKRNGCQFLRFAPVCDWSSIEAWCKTKNEMSFLPDDAVFLTGGATSAGDTREIFSFYPLFLQSKQTCDWNVTFKAGGKLGDFSASMEVCCGAIPAKIHIESAKAHDDIVPFDVLWKFWSLALETFTCLNGWTLAEGRDDQNRPIIRLTNTDEVRERIIGQYVRSLEAVHQTETEFWKFVHLVLGLLSFGYESVHCNPTSQLLMGISPKFFSPPIVRPLICFHGHYREEFRIEQLDSRFPKDGYWEFPLFSFKIEKSPVQVKWMQTPNERYLEFAIHFKEHRAKFEKYLTKCGIQLDLEFWESREADRWGLSTLAQK